MIYPAQRVNWGIKEEDYLLFPIFINSGTFNMHSFFKSWERGINPSRDIEGEICGLLLLGFFLQFVQKYQILEQSVNDFNKDLHPFIQQRKVEVRKMKRGNLLTARRFIKFGQSKFVQDLIKKYQSNKPVTFSTGFVVDFRNYLITILVIEKRSESIKYHLTEALRHRKIDKRSRIRRS